MAIDPAHVALVRRFAPILYFHPSEKFFPSDAKRYVEHCALWKAELPFDNKDSWGGKGNPFPRAPMIELGKIAALKSEVGSGDTFLGQAQGAVFPFLITDDNEERFLNLGGWSESPTDASSVDSDTPNRFPNLVGFTGVQDKYDSIAALKDSRYWYHAETFDALRLRQSGMSANVLGDFFAAFTDPFLICYYFFFPGHIEGIEGCEGTVIGPNFATFAGEWTCAAVLLDRKSLAPGDFQPRYMGLTSRNIGIPQFLDQERRIGMTVEDWSLLTTLGEHPRLFVASGTHSLYSSPNSRPIEPFTPDDPSWNSCGVAESLDEAIEDSGEQSPLWVKITSMIVVQIVGEIWAAAETHYSFGAEASAGQQVDYPPDGGNYGVVIHPEGVDLPDAAQAAEVVQWSVPSEPNHEKAIDGRKYSFMVDRRETDPNKQQVWWPSDGTHPGYAGRWGARVANDPRGRRAGMRFPEFQKMFLESLAKKRSMNPAPPGALTTVRINCGGATYTAADGRIFSADSSFVGGDTFITPDAISGTPDPNLYQSVRYKQFRYEIPVPDGTYQLKMHFAEVYFTQPGQRVFHVDVNGGRALTAFDSVTAGGGARAASVQTVPVTVVSGKAVITFTAVTDLPAINAIELIQLT